MCQNKLPWDEQFVGLCSGFGFLAELVEVDLDIIIGEVNYQVDNIVVQILAEATEELGKLVLVYESVLV